MSASLDVASHDYDTVNKNRIFKHGQIGICFIKIVTFTIYGKLKYSFASKLEITDILYPCI